MTKESHYDPELAKNLRQEFPIFRYHPGLVYLDNAATTQKPDAVIAAERFFYEHQNANVHRGAYRLADEATRLIEGVREAVRQWLNAPDVSEIIFTAGATEGINLVARGFLGERLEAGDAVVVTAMEHHANLIPWQQICRQKGARLLVAGLSPDGSLDLEDLENQFKKETGRVKMLAITHISNTLGTVNPLHLIVPMAHRYGVPVLVDAAQSIVTHTPDVAALGADFLVFSGHKMFGPTGTGILYGKKQWLNVMQPMRLGGGMIRDVSFENTVLAPAPQKFEAGTPNMAGIAGLGAAVEWIGRFGSDFFRLHGAYLLQYAQERLCGVPGLRFIGRAPEQSGIVSFLLEPVHPHDLATFLDQQQICARAGHHCTQPLMDLLEIPGTVRVSFSVYNTAEEIDLLAEALHAARAFFGG